MTEKKKVDPRTKRTNKYLRDALVDLLKEKDLASITVQEITDKAALTRGTFYLHYDDKQDFLNKSMSEVLDELISQVKPNQKDKQNSDTEEVPFLKLFHFIYEHADYFSVMLSERGLPQFRRNLTDIVKKRVYGEMITSIEESNKELDVPKDFLISYITSAHIGVICTWLENDMMYSPTFMAKNLTRLTLLGPIRVVGLENKIKLPY